MQGSLLFFTKLFKDSFDNKSIFFSFYLKKELIKSAFGNAAGNPKRIMNIFVLILLFIYNITIEKEIISE